MSSHNSKLKNFISKLPKWNSPCKGMELSLKEWLMYIIGCMGCYAIVTIIPFVGLQQGLYIAAACNVNVDHVAIIGMVSSLFTIITTPLISWLIDNTNTRIGKFRPYILFMPIPITICLFAIGQVIKIQNYELMLVVYTIINNLLNFFVRLYSASYTTIPQVISPNMEERTQIMSIGLMLSSAGPTLVNILFPFLANALYATDKNGSNGVNQAGSFVWLLPCIAIVFMLLGICLALGVKERTVIAKDFRQRQTFLQGCKKTFQNKYFWILNISQLFSTLKMTMTTLLLWYIIYDVAPTLTANGYETIAKGAQSVIQTLIGGACVPGMLFAPALIKKIGKRKLLLIINFGIAAASLPMVFIANAWVHIVCIFILNMFNGFQIVALPACQAEINDFQQYKTGDRIEGFLSQFGSIFLTAVAMGTAFIAPAVYKSFGYVEDTEVLYQHEVLFGITRTMAGIGLASAVLSAIPYFFWDMTEKKHKGIMEILKVRAKHSDGELNEEEAVKLENEIMQGNLFAFEEYCENSKEESDDKTSDVLYKDTDKDNN